MACPIPWQRPLDPCNQRCFLWIGRQRKPPVISNHILVISRRNIFVCIYSRSFIVGQFEPRDPHWKQVHCLFLFGRWHDHVARPSVGSCIVLIICVMLSDVNLHYWPWRRAVLSADAGLLVLNSCCSETLWWILLKFATFAPERR